MIANEVLRRPLLLVVKKCPREAFTGTCSIVVHRSTFHDQKQSERLTVVVNNVGKIHTRLAPTLKLQQSRAGGTATPPALPLRVTLAKKRKSERKRTRATRTSGAFAKARARMGIRYIGDVMYANHSECPSPPPPAPPKDPPQISSS